MKRSGRGKSGKFIKICQSRGKVRKDEIVLANDLEDVDVAHSVVILYPWIRVISVTFCYAADKLEWGGGIISQGK